jgi:hypothetical protein
MSSFKKSGNAVDFAQDSTSSKDMIMIDSSDSKLRSRIHSKAILALESE